MKIADTIDDLIEGLAQSLQRSVTVDDADLKLLGHSFHFEGPDPARMEALLGRGVSGKARDYVVSQRLQTWAKPNRLPVSTEHGFFHDRTGFPLRSRFELLGFMWVIDDERLSAEELQICGDVAKELTRILERRVQEQLASLEEEASILALVAPDASVRLDASRDLRDLGVLSSATEVAAIVVKLPDSASEEVTDLLRRGLSRTTLAQSRRMAAFAANANQAVLLVGALANPQQQRAQALKLAERIVAELAKLDARLSKLARIGLGSPTPLTEANTTYEQARTAVQIGEREKEVITVWAEHPLDALIEALFKPEVDGRLIPPQLSEVLASQGDDTIEVIRCFLDHAGNVAETAKILHMHRTTVYYRLQRFSESTGLDLEDGRMRFMIQLWLAARARRLFPESRRPNQA